MVGGLCLLIAGKVAYEPNDHMWGVLDDVGNVGRSRLTPLRILQQYESRRQGVDWAKRQGIRRVARGVGPFRRVHIMGAVAGREVYLVSLDGWWVVVDALSAKATYAPNDHIWGILTTLGMLAAVGLTPLRIPAAV